MTGNGIELIRNSRLLHQINLAEANDVYEYARKLDKQSALASAIGLPELAHSLDKHKKTTIEPETKIEQDILDLKSELNAFREELQQSVIKPSLISSFAK